MKTMVWRGAGLWFVLLALLVMARGATPPGLADAGTGDELRLSKGASRGAQVYVAKGCARCHRLWGEGGGIAPDLSLVPASTAAELAATLWNHSPRMGEVMKGSGIPTPFLSSEEMEDLFAFLYSVAYSDEPGDPARGKAALAEKGCSRCHSVSGQGGSVGPDLSAWAAFGNPVLWAQMMWNHAPNMLEKMAESGLPWPRLEGRQMVDIIAYIRSTAKELESSALAPGDGHQGAAVFQKKGCADCHVAPPGGKSVGPDLTVPSQDVRTVSQMAGVMWNHAPQMTREMAARRMPYPTLTPQEMADLTAYLFTLRYFDRKGTSDAGQKVFQAKHCSMCHEAGRGSKGGGPDLRHRAEPLTPIRLAQMAWNHGQGMRERMKQANVEWPELSKQEILDLIEYLNSATP